MAGARFPRKNWPAGVLVGVDECATSVDASVLHAVSSLSLYKRRIPDKAVLSVLGLFVAADIATPNR